MRPKQIILVRHGDYNGNDGHLSAQGAIDIKKLTENFLQKLIKNHSFAVHGSAADRAKESAEIIRDILHPTTFIIEDKLWSDAQHREDFEWLYSFIQSQTVDVLILVTHLEYVEYFPKFLREKESIKTAFNSPTKGEALIINLDDKLSSLVVPCPLERFDSFILNLPELKNFYLSRGEMFEDIKLVAKIFGYPLTELHSGIFELARKKIETDDVDGEADAFYLEEKKKNKQFFDVFRKSNADGKIYFFFESIQKNGSDEMILCMFDGSKHQAKNDITLEASKAVSIDNDDDLPF